jgi:hypothetical protein
MATSSRRVYKTSHQRTPTSKAGCWRVTGWRRQSREAKGRRGEMGYSKNEE